MLSPVFKSVLLVLSVAVVAIVIFLLYDMRREIARTNQLLQAQMTELLPGVKRANDTMMRVSKHLESLRDLAGSPAPTDRPFTAYVDSVLDFLERQPGAIGLEKTPGGKPSEYLPAAGWVHDVRKGVPSLVSHANAKAEVLESLRNNRLGASWYYAPPSGVPVPLIEFLKRHHPESGRLQLQINDRARSESRRY